MTRFNGNKRVKVSEGGSATTTESPKSGSSSAFNGSLFGSMGRKVSEVSAPSSPVLDREEAKRLKEKEKEKKERERKKGENRLLKGDTEVARLAKHYKEAKIPKDSFVEPAFEYMGETLTVWDVNEFCKTKESGDELRKKARRMGRMNEGGKKKRKRGDWAKRLCGRNKV